MPVVLFCFVFSWDLGLKFLATTTTIGNLPVVNHVCTVMEATSQPSLVLIRRVFADLAGNPTYESCWYCLSAQKESGGTQVRGFLTLKNEMRNWITENTKWWFWEKYFPSFQMFFTNDEFERMAFFPFLFLFGRLKSEFLMNFLR